MPRRVCRANVSNMSSSSRSPRLLASGDPSDPSDIWVLSSRWDCVGCVMVLVHRLVSAVVALCGWLNWFYGDTLDAFLGKCVSSRWVLYQLVCFMVWFRRNVGLMPFSLCLCLSHDVPSGLFVDSHLLASSFSINGLLFISLYMWYPHLFSSLVCICCFR